MSKKLSPLQQKNTQLTEGWLLRKLFGSVQVAPNTWSERLHFFLGPPGQGKTSTLFKVASRLLVEQNHSIAVVSTDNVKVGGEDQMKIFCKILNVPFFSVNRQSDWSEILAKCSNFNHILVDFPGNPLKGEHERAELRSRLPLVATDRRLHLVLSATSNIQDALEVGKRYRIFGFDDVIFTHLDEASQPGMIYSFQKAFQVGLNSFGIGSQIPEDFETATVERVVDLIFKIHDGKKGE